MLYDAAAGIYLTKTRAYNPKTGRFLQRDILDEDAKDGYKGFPFGKDAIGTYLYAWCGNNPVTREDPSGMAWSFRSIGARFLGGVGAAIGSFIDYSIGYVSGYVGCGGYSGYGYSGGGYGYSGYRGGSKTKKAVQAAVKAKPALKLKGPSASSISGNSAINPSKVTPWARSFLNTPAGRAYYNMTGSYSFDGGSGHRKTRNQVIMSETFKADGVIDINDKDQGGKEVGEYIHWYDSNVEAPLLMTAGAAGIGSGVALEIGCVSAGAGLGGLVCAPATAGIVFGSGSFAAVNYELWEGSDTYNAVSWLWGK